MANDGLPRESEPLLASAKKATAAKKDEADFVPSEEARLKDLAADTHSHWEFGGPLGVSAMMLGFPALMCESESDWQEGEGGSKGEREGKAPAHLLPFLSLCSFSLPLDLSLVL